MGQVAEVNIRKKNQKTTTLYHKNAIIDMCIE